MTKTINSGSKGLPWTYDRVCEKYRKSPGATKIECGIGAFTGLIIDPAAVPHIDPVCRRDILLTGLYARIEINGAWLEVWIPKNPRMRLYSLKFV